MTLSPNINDLEKQKFFEDDAGDVAVRTSAKGTFKLTGLNGGGLVTEVALNATSWTALPPTALTNRNAICIQNRSGVSIKLNYSDSVVGYVGIEISNNGERQYDITDDIVIYGKSSAGTAIINVEEIS